MKIVSVVGARPNFMKIAPFVRAVALSNSSIEHILVHTGQHYDDKMSKAFFDALKIPEADINLGVGSGTHAEQVGKTMIAFEKVLHSEKPDWVVVVGDVNATCACSITAKKEHVKVAHIEAGLRSYDLDMPEEINRMVTDRLSDLLFTTDDIACDNLRSEGVSEDKIRLVGNVMIDTLVANRDQAEGLQISDIVAKNSIDRRSSTSEISDFTMLTMHRPSNVDDEKVLRVIIDFLVDEVAPEMRVIWPIHPRAAKQLQAFGLMQKVRDCAEIIILNPIGYHEMLKLNMHARLVFTDSGGLQEECCVLGTPCLTLRANTERPITLEEHHGTNILAGNKIIDIRDGYNRLKDRPRKPHIPKFWDGHAAERIVEIFASI